MTLFFLLPAYNEAENIPALFGKISAFTKSTSLPCKIILVDDGSADNTSAAALNAKMDLNLMVINHPKNRGLAEALRTGFKKILSIAQSQDYVVIMDADNSHDPKLVSDMLTQLSTSCDGVIASRYLSGSHETGLSPMRKFLSYCCNFLLRILFPIKGVTDYTSGYRLFKVARLETLGKETSQKFFEAKGFVCTSELLINLVRSGSSFSEVPLILRYDLKKGQSKMRVTRTTLDYLNLFMRRRG